MKSTHILDVNAAYSVHYCGGRQTQPDVFACFATPLGGRYRKPSDKRLRLQGQNGVGVGGANFGLLCSQAELQYYTTAARWVPDADNASTAVAKNPPQKSPRKHVPARHEVTPERTHVRKAEGEEYMRGGLLEGCCQVPHTCPTSWVVQSKPPLPPLLIVHRGYTSSNPKSRNWNN